MGAPPAQWPDWISIRRLPARPVLGILSLAYGLYSLSQFPGWVQGRLSQPLASSHGDSGWLFTFGLPPTPWLVITTMVHAGRVAGLCLAGIGLLLTRPRVLLGGLFALAPFTVLLALLLPANVALLAGQSGWASVPPDLSPDLARQALVIHGAAAILATMLWALCFLWAGREMRRMSAGG